MNRRCKILVAEDDRNIRDGLVDALEFEGYAVCAAKDGHEALQFYHKWQPDLLILDIMMPVKSGYDVCRDVRRKNTRIPIIMLTAKSEEFDKVLGLELGADDYICKPFGLRELMARIKAVLRRVENQLPETDEATDGTSDTIRFGDVVIQVKKMIGDKNGTPFEVTQKEVQILTYFVSRKGEVVKRNDLMAYVWGPKYHSFTRTIDQTIANLRKKIETDTKHPEYIKTVYGVGYKFME